jgi:hypothetical protein
MSANDSQPASWIFLAKTAPMPFTCWARLVPLEFVEARLSTIARRVVSPVEDDAVHSLDLLRALWERTQSADILAEIAAAIGGLIEATSRALEAGSREGPFLLDSLSAVAVAAVHPRTALRARPLPREFIVGLGSAVWQFGVRVFESSLGDKAIAKFAMNIIEAEIVWEEEAELLIEWVDSRAAADELESDHITVLNALFEKGLFRVSEALRNFMQRVDPDENKELMMSLLTHITRIGERVPLVGYVPARFFLVCLLSNFSLHMETFAALEYYRFGDLESADAELIFVALVASMICGSSLSMWACRPLLSIERLKRDANINPRDLLQSIEVAVPGLSWCLSAIGGLIEAIGCGFTIEGEIAQIGALLELRSACVAGRARNMFMRLGHMSQSPAGLYQPNGSG